MFFNFSLKTPQCVIISQRSASKPKAAGPVRSTRAILERHLADKMLDLPKSFYVHIRLDMSSLSQYVFQDPYLNKITCADPFL